MKNVKLKIISASFLAALGSFLPAASLAAGPAASANCSDVHIVIKMTPPKNHSHWAVRIDDRSNSFQPTDMRPGDVLVDRHTSNNFEVKGQAGEIYNWWVHSIDTSGKWSEATGGPLNCPLKAPVGLESSYIEPYVTISWNPVKNAVKYAIRVDNTVNPWTPNAMQDGDHLRNSYTETSYRFKAAPNRKVVYWIHAVDKFGAYSPASWSYISTK